MLVLAAYLFREFIPCISWLCARDIPLGLDHPNTVIDPREFRGSYNYRRTKMTFRHSDYWCAHGSGSSSGSTPGWELTHDVTLTSDQSAVWHTLVFILYTIQRTRGTRPVSCTGTRTMYRNSHNSADASLIVRAFNVRGHTPTVYRFGYGTAWKV